MVADRHVLHRRAMTEIAHPLPSPSRPGLVLRWLAATVVVATVFVGARATVADNETDATLPTEGSPGPKAGWLPPLSPGPEEPEQEGADGEVSVGAGAGEATTGMVTGRGAAGGTWSMTVPAGWVAYEDAGVTMLDSPDRPRVAVVVSRPYIGPIDDEAARDLQELSAQLSDLHVLELETTSESGRHVARAQLEYTAPDGEPSSVSINWIRDDSSLYLVAGDAPISDPALRESLARVLDSFALTATSQA